MRRRGMRIIGILEGLGRREGGSLERAGTWEDRSGLEIFYFGGLGTLHGYIYPFLLAFEGAILYT